MLLAVTVEWQSMQPAPTSAPRCFLCPPDVPAVLPLPPRQLVQLVVAPVATVADVEWPLPWQYRFQAGQLYPDANGSLRLSFGRVDGYTPKDGMVYLPQTSRLGMVRKAGEAPFDAPMKILQKPAGSKWVDPGLKDVPIDFLSTVDNTGGNSGSPTLNAKGEVVGFVFDRNWDAVAADWIYDAATTRSIHADIRYLLWLLDDAGGGEALLKELMPGG